MTATPCPHHQLLLWDRADFVTARGARAHAHVLEGPGKSRARQALQDPGCRETGGSLFITVFIVLGAACLVLERGF